MIYFNLFFLKKKQHLNSLASGFPLAISVIIINTGNFIY